MAWATGSPPSGSDWRENTRGSYLFFMEVVGSWITVPSPSEIVSCATSFGPRVIASRPSPVSSLNLPSPSGATPIKTPCSLRFVSSVKNASKALLESAVPYSPRVSPPESRIISPDRKTEGVCLPNFVKSGSGAPRMILGNGARRSEQHHSNQDQPSRAN